MTDRPTRDPNLAPDADAYEAALNGALARFAGRPGLRAYMSDEEIRRVEEYRGPVVLGQPVLRVGGRVIAAERERLNKEYDFGSDDWQPVDGSQFSPSPEGGWVGLQAIQSESTLGEHDGVLDDDLLDIIFKTETKQ